MADSEGKSDAHKIDRSPPLKPPSFDPDSRNDSYEHERGERGSLKIQGREKGKRHDGDRTPDRNRDRDRRSAREERNRDRERDEDYERNRVREKDRYRRARDRERDEDYERNQVRVRERERHHRDKERSERDRRTDREGNQSGGHYGRDGDRHGRRQRSRSRSRGRSSHRRSRSRPRSGFDMVPPAAASQLGSPITGQLPGATTAVSGMLPNIVSQSTGRFPNLPGMSPTQQASHARCVFVGRLPHTANEQSVTVYFNQVMSAIGGNTAGPGDAVVKVSIDHEKRLACVEMRSVEEASNAMALDGIVFEEAPLDISRPPYYNSFIAAALGPSQPKPDLNLAAVGLTPGSAGGLEGPDRIFVSGLPDNSTETQVRGLLESFGTLRGFKFVKNRETGNSEGFCVYQDVSVTDVVCAALDGIRKGDKTMIVQRANQGATQHRRPQEEALLQALQKVALERPVYKDVGSPFPTKVICLTGMVSVDELRTDEEYQKVVRHMRRKGETYGKLVNVVIPRPGPNGEVGPEVGNIYLEYADIDGSIRAKKELNREKFGKKSVVADFSVLS